MRETIFNQALHLFSERGFEGASMRELARRCGTTPSNVYNYFASKEELLREVFGTGVEQIFATLDAGRDGDVIDLRRYLKSVLRTIDENRPLWKLIHQLRHNEQVQTILEEDFTSLANRVQLDLADYCKEPWLLLAIVDGLAATMLTGVQIPTEDEIVGAVVECIEHINESR